MRMEDIFTVNQENGQFPKEPTATIAKINAMQQDFTKAEKKVAAVITEDPEQVIYASIAELAQSAGVSEPTVIRFARKIGMNGYQDLKLTLARELVSPLQAINGQITRQDDVGSIVSKVFNGTIETLNFTRDALSLPDLEKAAELIGNARRIIIVGMGNSHAICIDLLHKLLRLNLDVSAYSDPHMATIALVHADERDVLFAISHSGSSKEIVDLAKEAADKNVHVISITGSGITPLARYSEITLHTVSNEIRYSILGRESRIAELAIIDSIYTLLALKYENSAFLEVENALKSHKY